MAVTASCGIGRCSDVTSIVFRKGSDPAASSGRGAYSGVGQCKFVGIGTGRSHGDLDTAHGDANLGADFQQFQPDRAAGGFGKSGVDESDATQGADQNVGERSEPKPQLIGPHGVGAGAVGIQVELALFDTVFLSLLNMSPRAQ